MLKKLKTSAKLTLLVSVLAFFILGVGIYGIRAMKKMNQNIQTIYADRVLAIQQLTNIRYSYATGILAMAEQLENHQVKAGVAKDKIEVSEKIINDNWQAYLKTYLTPEETELIRQTDPLKAEADKATAALKQKIQKEGTSLSGDIIDEEMYAAINPVITKLNELIRVQIKVSSELNKTNAQLYHSTLEKFYILIIASLLLAIILAFFIIGDTRKIINELNSSNKKIKEAEEKCKAYIRYAGDAIFILDQDLLITDVNNSACNLLGYPKEEMLKMKITDIMAPEEKEIFSTRVEMIKKEGGSLHERKLKRKDGSVADTEVNVRILDGVGYISIIRDISERKKAALAIKESEEKYRYLFQNNPACVIVWDLETMNVLEVNNVVIDKYGYSKEEWMNMSVFHYRPEEDHERIREFAKSILNSNEPVSRMTWTHLKKNGDEMQMEISSHKILYNNRNAILSLANDITEQVKAQGALRKNEEVFRSLIDHAADAIFLVTDKGIIFDINRSATELLGYSKDELTGTTVLALHPKEAQPEVPQIWEVLKKNKSYIDERKLQRKDGSLVEVEISRKMLPDASGAIAIVRDITERKRAEEIIRQSEANYRQLFDLSPAPMWVVEDETLRFIQVNKACINNYGFSKEEFEEMTIHDIISYNDESVLKNYQFSNSFMQTGRHKKKSGELMDVETSGIPVVLNGKKRLLMIAIDVTEKNLYEQKLTRASIKAQEEERYEIGGELHDNVCQLLVVSLLYLGMMKKSLTPGAEEYFSQTHQYISLASDEIRNLSHRLAPAFFDDATLEDAFIQLLKNFNIEEKFEISLDFDQAAKSYPISRELQLNLYRILQEQLRNIFKHANATSIAVNVSLNNDTLVMKVADNGKGFDPETKKGGIGLANMNRRVQLFSGNFIIHSAVGQGCKVLVEIPLPGIVV